MYFVVSAKATRDYKGKATREISLYMYNNVGLIS